MPDLNKIITFSIINATGVAEVAAGNFHDLGLVWGIELVGLNGMQHYHKDTHMMGNYTERQKKLITSSKRRSLKSTASKLIIFRHR